MLRYSPVSLPLGISALVFGVSALVACSAGEGDGAELSQPGANGGKGGQSIPGGTANGGGGGGSIIDVGGEAGSPEEPAICGDRAKQTGEACDDGNKVGGDGCSADCTKIEAGYQCPVAGSSCWKCGNGKRERGEACDDGNTTAKDGCSADCATIEPGFACGIPGQACTICGDGKLAPGETCDDGGIVSKDGCDATCQVEPGWLCPAVGQPCQECGNGKVDSLEQCDDGNKEPGDGCDGACAVEAGWDCSVAGKACTAAGCGDGTSAGAEQCDDGNLLAGDGCSNLCKRERGWVCVSGAACRKTVCGDGSKEGDEGCDDSNVLAGDGCSATCVLEEGYDCRPGQACVKTVCGDGKVEGTERCDDGGTTPKDGCDGSCKLEPGYACPTPGKPCAAEPCGNGVVAGLEQCDDGNKVASDGCTGCVVDPLWTCAGGTACRRELEFVRITAFNAPLPEIQSVHYDPLTRSFVGYNRDPAAGDGVEFCTNGTVLAQHRSRWGIDASFGAMDGAAYDPFTDGWLFVTYDPNPALKARLHHVTRAGVRTTIELRRPGAGGTDEWDPGSVAVGDDGRIYITEQCLGKWCSGVQGQPKRIFVFSREDFSVVLGGGQVAWADKIDCKDPTLGGSAFQTAKPYTKGQRFYDTTACLVFECTVASCSQWWPVPPKDAGWDASWAVSATCGGCSFPKNTLAAVETITVPTQAPWFDSMWSIPGLNLLAYHEPNATPANGTVEFLAFDGKNVASSKIPGPAFLSGVPVTSSTVGSFGGNRADGAASATDGGYFLLCPETVAAGQESTHQCQLFGQACATDEDCVTRLPGTACNLSKPVSGKGWCEPRAVARDDGYRASINSSANRFEVTRNDTASANCTGKPPQVKSIGTLDQGGTATVAPGSTAILYTPKAGFCGVETFRYTADLGGVTDDATVKVLVQCVCGDKTVGAGEQCDDGNTTPGDGCSPTCAFEQLCGDFRIGPGEECDDGNTKAGDGCSPTCTYEGFCGDGIAEGLEECDDGNRSNRDKCRNDCRAPRCGDKVVDFNEQCDDGNTNSGDGCSETCTVEVN